MNIKIDKDMIVFAGPSGVGKSTLCNILLHHYKNFEFSISATTRKIRLGEKNGTNYYFFSKDEFKGYIEGEAFIEWEEVYPGCYYGTLKSEVDRILRVGKKVVFDIDVLGALNIKKIFGDRAHIIFVKSESIEALTERLRYRGSESEEELKVRIDRFEKELFYEGSFDDVVINKTGDLNTTQLKIIDIVEKNFETQKKETIR